MSFGATDKLFKGTIMVVGAVIGLVIIADVISEETYDPEDADDEGTISEDSIAGTIVNYIVPLLALALLSGAVAVWRLR